VEIMNWDGIEDKENHEKRRTFGLALPSGYATQSKLSDDTVGMYRSGIEENGGQPEAGQPPAENRDLPLLV
jgi:hypothetical protein